MSNLPAEFLDYQLRELGEPLFGRFVEAMESSEADVSVRLNSRKPSVHERFGSCAAVEWCPLTGRYLDERPVFTLDPTFHGGAYYVQEASSMFVDWIMSRLDMQAPRVLDLCAAPGGKTTLLAEHASVVVANEVIRPRARILSENCQKWGSGNIAVTSNDPADFGSHLPEMFDVILVDAPCSGEGMFRKDPAARDQWSTEAVKLCVQRQRRIVADVWSALREGGVLIYSTCTFNRQENEQNVTWICAELGAEVLEFDDTQVSLPAGVVRGECGFRFYPSMIRGEGFFVAAIRKHGDGVRYTLPRSRTSRNVMTPLGRAQSIEALRWVGHDLNFAIGANNVYGFSDAMFEIIETLRERTNLLYSGVLMGEFMRESLKPSHSLALYHDVRHDDAVSEIDYADAVAYLRKDVIRADKFEESLSLVLFDGVALGWNKRIGNRCNNLYPQQWRILLTPTAQSR